MSIVANMHSMT